MACSSVTHSTYLAMLFCVAVLGVGFYVTMFARHSVRLSPEEIRSVRLYVEQSTLWGPLVFFKLFWLDTLISLASLILAMVYVLAQAFPLILRLVIFLVAFAYSIYYLQARLLPMIETGHEDGGDIVFGMRPPEIRSAMSNVVSALKSFATFVFVSATVVVAMLPLRNTNFRDLFQVALDPLLYAQSTLCFAPLRDLSANAQAMALVLGVLLAPLLLIALFGCASLGRLFILLRHVLQRRERARGQYDEAIRLQMIASYAQASRSSIATSFRSFSFVILTMSQFSVIQLVALVYSCSYFPFGSYSVLFPDIECQSAVHWRLIAAANAIAIIYMIGYLTTMLRVTALARAGRLREPMVLRAYGIVYESFAPNRWWFESLNAARRISLAMLYGLVSSNSFTYAAVSCSILVCSFVLQCWFWPVYLSKALNRLELVTAVYLVGAGAIVQSNIGSNTSLAFVEKCLELILSVYIIYLSVQVLYLIPYVRDLVRYVIAQLLKSRLLRLFLISGEEMHSSYAWRPAPSEQGPVALRSVASFSFVDELACGLQERLRAADAAATRAEQLYVGAQIRVRRERAELEATLEMLRAEHARRVDELGARHAPAK